MAEVDARVAARSLAAAGRHRDAAVAYLHIGESRDALDNLVRIPVSDHEYRSSARWAVALAVELEVVELRLENFLSSFIATGPQDDAETAAFCDLARLYARRGFRENAEEALRKVLARAPEWPEAVELLEGLRDSAAGERPAEELLRSDLDFRRGAPTTARPSPPPDVPAYQDTMPLEAPAAPREPTRVLQSPIPTSPFHPGAIVAGRYRLEAEIGRGGMATVFRALDLELNEPIALKAFMEAEGESGTLERFRQELRVSRRLHHANLVRVYDLGVHAGRRYITMELLEGDTLGAQMGKPLSFARGVGYLLDACAGLHAAHQEGIIHRDIKPSNLFVMKDDRVKVMDFGIARQLAAPGLTIDGAIVGTPAYMAPEQIRGFRAVTPAADLYALGIVGYEMFTGTPPFQHESVVPVLMMQLEQAPAPPRSRNPGMPAELEAILLRLLRKEPERRYRDCRSLAEALDALLG